MALISVLAQPGMAFMESANAARENRLAMAAAEAERATAESQQEIRQRAFQSLQAGQANPEQVAAQLFGAGMTQEGTAALGMARAQEQTRTAQERADQARIEGRNELLGVMAQRDDLDDPVVREGFNTRLANFGETVDTVSPLLPTFRNPRQFELIEQGHPDYPPGGTGVFQRNRQSGQITSVGGTRTTEMGEIARGLGALAASNSERASRMSEPRFAAQSYAESDRLRASAQASQTLIDVADDLLQSIDETGSVALFGAAGLARRNVTGLLNTMQELSEFTGGMSAPAQSAMRAIDGAVRDASSSGMEPDVFERLFGDDKISSVDLLANALSYLNARIYEPTGPLSTSDIVNHRVEPGMFGSTGGGIARINTVIQRAVSVHDRAREDMTRLDTDPEGYFFSIPPLARRRDQPAAPAAPAAQGGGEVDISGMSRDEIERRLRELEGG